MIWYIAESNTLKEMSEEVLIYKIKNGEIDPGTLVVNEKIRESLLELPIMIQAIKNLVFDLLLH